MNSEAISKWDLNERPREKFLKNGGENLGITELLAIIIGSGSRGRNAVELAREIWDAAGHSMHTLATFRFEEFAKFKGIGQSKAISIMAVVELAKRTALESVPEMPQIYSSESACKYVQPILKDLAHEECWILFLNRSNKLIAREKVSSGGTCSTVLDIKIIIKRALLKLASGIILVHNHPSGNNRPGTQDKEQTRKLMEAAKTCEISLLAHIIIAGNKYFSFADNGLL